MFLAIYHPASHSRFLLFRVTEPVDFQAASELQTRSIQHDPTVGFGNVKLAADLLGAQFFEFPKHEYFCQTVWKLGYTSV